MPFVSVPKDLSKVKTKVAFNLTRRQLICFSVAGFIGVPSYLFTRSHIGNEAAVLLMVGLMLPFFFLAMYERDGQTLEKIIRNILRARFLRPKVRPYQTQNLYAFLTKWRCIMQNKQQKRQAEKLQKSIQQQRRNKKSDKLSSEKKKDGNTSFLLRTGKFFSRKEVPTTAQQTIPYQEIYPDGICRVDKHFFTKTLEFFDINYQLAQNEDKTLILKTTATSSTTSIPPSGCSFPLSIKWSMWRNTKRQSISQSRRMPLTASAGSMLPCSKTSLLKGITVW